MPTSVAPLCACGCGNPVRMRYGHWNTYLKGHARKGKSKLGYEVDVETGCWVWQGATNEHGYGVRTIRGDERRTRKAHIQEWEKVNGPVPEGFELDHTCRNPPCVNPAHLEAVTHAENMRRSPNCVLNEDKVREIRRLLAAGMLQKHVADRVGVHRRLVSHVKCGQTWVGVGE